MSTQLDRECVRAARRAKTIRMTNFRYTVEGDTVTLEGETVSAEGRDSVAKVFAMTSAREVKNQLQHAPDDPTRPGAITSPRGYVDVIELGPNGSRLVETTLWEVRSGDTLESIAATVYGDASKTAPIRQANLNQISESDHIRVGLKLRIPACP